MMMTAIFSLTNLTLSIMVVSYLRIVKVRYTSLIRHRRPVLLLVVTSNSGDVIGVVQQQQTMKTWQSATLPELGG